MKKTLIALAAALVLLLVVSPLLSGLLSPAAPVAGPPVQSAPAPTPEPTPTPVPTPTVSTVRFSATGDNLIHNGIYSQAAKRAAAEGKEGYDFSFCYDQMRDFYAGFDLNWINQETLVNDELEPSTYPTFSTPGDMGRELYDVGFRVFSLSNNHTYDKGAAGIAATRRFWASMPQDILTTGLFAGEADYENIPIKETNGIKIAYLSYTQYTNGLPTPQGAEANIIYTSETDVIQRQVELARQQADFVVVGVHWGVEGSHTVTDGQRQLAQQLADWGAGVVIGTHPHVVQDAQWLTAADGRQVFVAYSLGNFLNAQSTADTMIGAVLTFALEKTTQPSGASATVLKDPLLCPTVNHYGSNYSQIRMYLFRDYTDELAAGHGVRVNFPGFSRSYIESVLRNSINEQFLDL